jgi:sec-independent protein translocase protein TatA
VIGDILQPTHLIFILVVALLVLGPKRLPEVGRSLGRGIRDFRNALSMDEPERDPLAAQAHPQPQPPVAAPQPEPVAVAHEPSDHPS